jgi:fatty-acyl-CoA synthase
MKKPIEERRLELKKMYPFWERQTLHGRFNKTSYMYPENVFIYDELNSVTYEEARNKINNTAKSLLGIGIKKRERVIISLKNCQEFVYFIFAISKIGAIAIPINDRVSINEFKHILSNSQATCIVANENEKLISNVLNNLLPEFQENKLSSDFSCVKKIIVLNNRNLSINSRVITYEFFMKNQVGTNILNNREAACSFPDEVACIFYTSGTTGSSKGVMHTHDALWRSSYSSCLNRGFEISRRVYNPLPLFHVYGFIEGMLNCIMVAGMLVMQNRFDCENAFPIMEKAKINDIICLPLMAIKMLSYSDRKKYDLSNLYAMYCSATPTPLWVWKKLFDEFKLKEVITGYGMTEVCGASMQTDVNDSLERLAETVGKIRPSGCGGLLEYDFKNIEYKVVDIDTGKRISDNNIGELYCRGNVVTKGYFNDPMASNKYIDFDGWLRTGDVGYFDSDGYLHFTGRVKDMYKMGGENVLPQNIEKIIEKHPAIAVCQIVGIKDEKMGEVGAAFIQLTEGNKITKVELDNYCKKNLSHYEVPKYYRFICQSEWPLTANNKIQKIKLKEKIEGEIKNEGYESIYS